MRSIFKALDGAHLDGALFGADDADKTRRARDDPAEEKRLFGGRGFGWRDKREIKGRRDDPGRTSRSDGYV